MSPEELQALQKRVRLLERELTHTQRARGAAEQLVERHQRVLSQAHAELRQTLDDLVATQNRLVEAEKMATMGRFVAGVAHELNNPLAMIGAASQQLDATLSPMLDELLDRAATLDPGERDDLQRWLRLAADRPHPSSRDARRARRRLQSALEAEGLANSIDAAEQLVDLGIVDGFDDELAVLARPGRPALLALAHRIAAVRTSVKTIHGGARRAASIVTALKQSARTSRSGPPAAASIRARLSELLGRWPEPLDDVQVVQEAADAGELVAHHDELDEVWTHLIRNALQAMDGPGTLTIGVATDAHRVTVTVGDTGGGIPAEILGRVFDPFFTTRQVGDGPGLGLSVCREIVRSHGGQITVQSQPGDTRFTVTLPTGATSDGAPAPAPAP